MSNDTNKPTEAQELTDKELEGVVGGIKQPPGVDNTLLDRLPVVDILPMEPLGAMEQLAWAHD